MSKSLHEQVTEAYEKVAQSENDGSIAKEEPIQEEEQHIEKPEADVAESHEENEGHTQKEEDDAPEHWSQQDREVFKSLDKKGKDFLLRRHKEMEASHTKKLQLLASEAKLAENFKKAVGPYESYLKQLNIEPTQAFEKLISTEMRLRMASPQERQILLNDLARQYGVQMAQDANGQQPQVDEKTRALFDELNNQRAYLIRKDQEEKQREMQGLANQIETFSKTKDDKGSLKYPHFESLRQDMGVLMNAGKAETLEEAYDKAMWLNPDLRREYIERQATAQKQEVDSKQKAAASKKAGFNVRSSSDAKIKEPKQTLTTRQALERAFAEHSRG